MNIYAYIVNIEFLQNPNNLIHLVKQIDKHSKNILLRQHDDTTILKH